MVQNLVHMKPILLNSDGRGRLCFCVKINRGIWYNPYPKIHSKQGEKTNGKHHKKAKWHLSGKVFCRSGRSRQPQNSIENFQAVQTELRLCGTAKRTQFFHRNHRGANLKRRIYRGRRQEFCTNFPRKNAFFGLLRKIYGDQKERSRPWHVLLLSKNHLESSDTNLRENAP